MLRFGGPHRGDDIPQGDDVRALAKLPAVHPLPVAILPAVHYNDANEAAP